MKDCQPVPIQEAGAFWVFSCFTLNQKPKRRMTHDICLLFRTVGFLPASVRAVLPPEGSLLSGSKFYRSDESRRPPAAASALPQRWNQGASQGNAPLHRSGPVSGTTLCSGGVWILLSSA